MKLINASGMNSTNEFMKEKNTKPERVENTKPIAHMTTQIIALALFPAMSCPLRYIRRSMSVSSIFPIMLNITFIPTHDNMRKKRKIHSLVYLKVANAAGYVMKIRSMPSAGKLLITVSFWRAK